MRSLAQRSAAAAREIKTLISARVERVEQSTAAAESLRDQAQQLTQAIQAFRLSEAAPA